MDRLVRFFVDLLFILFFFEAAEPPSVANVQHPLSLLPILLNVCNPVVSCFCCRSIIDAHRSQDYTIAAGLQCGSDQ